MRPTWPWRWQFESGIPEATTAGTVGQEPAPIVFEDRFVVQEDASWGLLIRLTRRDGVSSSQERIEGRLVGPTLSFDSPDLTAVFRRR